MFLRRVLIPPVLQHGPAPDISSFRVSRGWVIAPTTPAGSECSPLLRAHYALAGDVIAAPLTIIIFLLL